MKKSKIIISITALLLCLITLSFSAGAESTLPFSDVKTGAWYYENVKTVYDAGIMEGKAEGVFAPSSNVTRAEFITVLSRLAGESTENCREHIKSFNDVNLNAWYADALGWGVKTGLVNGTGNGKLSPNKSITRGEIATLIARLADYLDITIPSDIYAEKSFTDVKNGKYYTEAVDLMRKSCIVNGDGNGHFRPADTAKRSEIAAVTARFMACREKAESFPDSLPVITIVTETGRDVESKEEYIRADFTLKAEDGRNRLA